MRIPYLGLFIILLLNVGVDALVWHALRRGVVKRRIWSVIQLWTAAVLNAGIVALFFLPVKSTSDSAMLGLMWIIFVYISIYVPKYVFAVFYGVSRLPVLWRRKPWCPVSWFGAGCGIVLFFVIWWGALINRFCIDVKDVDVEIAGLPAAFDGFRIAQISDLHVGTYQNDSTFLVRLVDEVNSLKPDIIVFTGDIVNRHTSELEPFAHVLSDLHARYGVYSILGNHDYGDYYDWPDSTARKENNDRLTELQKGMGWTLLKNESRTIAIDGDSLVIIGVENIGDPPFHIYGNLDKAYPDVGDAATKILLSHNPAHWVKAVSGHDDVNIALTLSGHTHAMQMSIFGWSPASFRYRTWGGLYGDENNRHWLYVNIGTGTVGFPARIGAAPEITLLTLKRIGTEQP